MAAKPAISRLSKDWLRTVIRQASALQILNLQQRPEQSKTHQLITGIDQKI